MFRMKRLQEEKEDEEASQEEMNTRFEKEKTESLLVVAEGTAPLVSIITFYLIQLSEVYLKELGWIKGSKGK